jgi:hypothetical protein
MEGATQQARAIVRTLQQTLTVASAFDSEIPPFDRISSMTIECRQTA